jgi:hypothetical protein
MKGGRRAAVMWLPVKAAQVMFLYEDQQEKMNIGIFQGAYAH